MLRAGTIVFKKCHPGRARRDDSLTSHDADRGTSFLICHVRAIAPAVLRKTSLPLIETSALDSRQYPPTVLTLTDVTVVDFEGISFLRYPPPGTATKTSNIALCHNRGMAATAMAIAAKMITGGGV
ncbi:hypothetical protein HZH68_010697 [Vespula germanica]|uniref:Uncharacterized protein n=1 Tax=Vespula germanica TaxID=30212 RepID=A0A834JSC4_VESGE|nr:hypothetical protein HZH68_010697 [Vespula germanica]